MLPGQGTRKKVGRCEPWREESDVNFDVAKHRTAIKGVSHPTLMGLWSLVPKASKLRRDSHLFPHMLKGPNVRGCTRLSTAKEENTALNNLFVDLHPV